MSLSDRAKKLLEAAKNLAAKRGVHKQQLQAPDGSCSLVTAPDSEELLQLEQHEVAGIIDDAMALLSAPSSQAAKTALRERAEKLSPSARITARVLTKVRMNSRYPVSGSRSPD